MASQLFCLSRCECVTVYQKDVEREPVDLDLRKFWRERESERCRCTNKIYQWCNCCGIPTMCYNVWNLTYAITGEPEILVLNLRKIGQWCNCGGIPTFCLSRCECGTVSQKDVEGLAIYLDLRTFARMRFVENLKSIADMKTFHLDFFHLDLKTFLKNWRIWEPSACCGRVLLQASVKLIITWCSQTWEERHVPEWLQPSCTI